MALKGSNQAIIDERRWHVASLILRGRTQREVEQELPELTPPIVNPKNGKPYALGTINADVKAIREQWRAEAVRDIAEHKARILAELGEVKRAAWTEKDFSNILRALEKEVRIMGIDSPDKQIILNAELEEFLNLLPEENQNAVRKLIIANLGGGGAPGA